MKETTGELNATVFTVIIVASLVAFFYFTIWPAIQNNLNSNTACSKATCASCPAGETCQTVTCYLPGDSSKTFECVYKG